MKVQTRTWICPWFIEQRISEKFKSFSQLSTATFQSCVSVVAMANQIAAESAYLRAFQVPEAFCVPNEFLSVTPPREFKLQQRSRRWPRLVSTLFLFLFLQANDAYRMSSSPRGRMLIINNKSFPRFEGRASERRGTDIDATKLKGMFVTFGFHVTQKDNLTSQVRQPDVTGEAT